MKEETQNISNIIKKEAIGYLKGKLNMQQGNLVLTDKKLTLDAHKSTVNIFGLVGALLKRYVEKSKLVFDLEFSQIRSIANVKFGINKNVMEITDSENNKFNIMVKNYAEWEAAIKERM